MNAQRSDTQGPVQVPGFVITPGVHRSGSTLPRHWHDTPTICYVMNGRFTEYVAGQALECRAGAVHLMPAGETHWNRFAWGDTRGVRIDVDAERWRDSPAFARLLADEAHVERGVPAMLVERVLGELAIADDATPLAIEGMLLELLAALARETRPRGAPTEAGTAGASWLAQARELVLTDAPLTLAEVARRVGVHPVTLARAWRRAHGCTLGESVRRARVERAARALAETDHTLGEIALAAGFYDQSHFTHIFRRLMGVTPGAYRARRG